MWELNSYHRPVATVKPFHIKQAEQVAVRKTLSSYMHDMAVKKKKKKKGRVTPKKTRK